MYVVVRVVPVTLWYPSKESGYTISISTSMLHTCVVDICSVTTECMQERFPGVIPHGSDLSYV